MANDPHVVIFPGWYPTEHHPYSGDFVQFQADMLQRGGLDLSVMFLDLDYRYGLTQWFAKDSSFVDDFGIKTYASQGFALPKWNASRIAKWGRVYLRLYERYRDDLPTNHVIHAHNYMGGIGAYFVHQKFGVPYVITEHSTAFMSGDIPRHHSAWLRKSFDAADAILPVSTALAECISRYTISKIEVIPNFIDQELFMPSVEKYDRFTFVFAGSLIARKRPKLAIEALSILCQDDALDAQLLIIGEGEMESVLQQSAQSLGIADRVRFLGQKNIVEVAHELGKSHTLLLTSEFETFGLVLIEALSCGIPIISTDSGGPRDIVNNNNGVLLRSATVDDLAQAIRLVMNNKGEFKTNDLRQYVKDHFSAGAILPQLHSVYASALAKSS